MKTDGDYETGLQRVFEIQDTIVDVHPFLTRIFPIAIVENDEFLIFDTDPSGEGFVLAKRAPTPMPIPAGVRAAFPLECFGSRPACVVSGDVFDSLTGYVAIFHEFVHCRQMESCEFELKQKLRIARDAADRGDCMWELNYPFPYEDPQFIHLYGLFLDQLRQRDAEQIQRCRKELSVSLPSGDCEYMVWQEWKEGFARFIENRIRQRLDLSENHGGREEPFDRVVFYEGGAGFVEFLGAQDPRMTVEIDRLFETMFRWT